MIYTLLNIAAICAVVWASTERSRLPPLQDHGATKVTDAMLWPCACRCSGELLDGLYFSGTIEAIEGKGVVIRNAVPGGGLVSYQGAVLPIEGAVELKSYKPPALGSAVEYRYDENPPDRPGGRILAVRLTSPAGTIQKRIRVLLIEQLGVDEKEVVLDAKLVDDLGADVTDLPEMINAIEVEFGLEITQDEIDLLGPCVKHVTEYVIRRLLRH